MFKLVQAPRGMVFTDIHTTVHREGLVYYIDRALHDFVYAGSYVLFLY